MACNIFWNSAVRVHDSQAYREMDVTRERFIGGRTICIADDIDGLAGEEEELAKLVDRLDKACTAYDMEISAEKIKLKNNTSGINTEIKVNEQKLETVTNFKYLGSVITDEGSKPEILSRIAQRTAASTRLELFWCDRSIFLSSTSKMHAN